MAWETPKTDWVANPKSPVGEDFNRIEGNIAFLKDDIATRFSNVQTEIETKKGVIVDAINDMDLNQSAEITDTYIELANKIRGINCITSIQQGVVQGRETLQVNIEPVDVNSSIILVSSPSRVRAAASAGITGAEIINNTTIELRLHSTTRGSTGTVSGPNVRIGWIVIEFNPNIVKSLQKGTATFTDTGSVSISTVNRSKSIVIAISSSVSGSGTINDSPAFRFYGVAATIAADGNSIILSGNNDGYSRTCSWQVIEFV